MEGWQRDTRAKGEAWVKQHGKYIIVVAKVYDGWQFTWQRGYGYTVREGRGFPTLEACMAKLWDQVFEIHEHYLELLKLQAARIARGETT